MFWQTAIIAPCLTFFISHYLIQWKSVKSEEIGILQQLSTENCYGVAHLTEKR